VTVSGTVAAGSGVLVDAECSTTTADRVWSRDRLDVLVDKQAANLAAVTSNPTSACDATHHTYRSVVKPWNTRPINVRIDDPAFLDNTGALTVTVTRFVQPAGAETVAVDSKAAAGAQTTRIYQAGRPVRVTTTGTYAFAAGSKADAECTSTAAAPSWHNPARGGVDGSGNSLRDVTVGGHSVDWRTSAGASASCDAIHHSYSLTYTPSTNGPLTFGVADTSYGDNSGTVTVTVVPVG
jgi:hypothetical protein